MHSTTLLINMEADAFENAKHTYEGLVAAQKSGYLLGAALIAAGVHEVDIQIHHVRTGERELVLTLVAPGAVPDRNLDFDTKELVP